MAQEKKSTVKEFTKYIKSEPMWDKICDAIQKKYSTSKGVVSPAEFFVKIGVTVDYLKNVKERYSTEEKDDTQLALKLFKAVDKGVTRYHVDLASEVATGEMIQDTIISTTMDKLTKEYESFLEKFGLDTANISDRDLTNLANQWTPYTVTINNQVTAILKKHFTFYKEDIFKPLASVITLILVKDQQFLIEIKKQYPVWWYEHNDFQIWSAVHFVLRSVPIEVVNMWNTKMAGFYANNKVPIEEVVNRLTEMRKRASDPVDQVTKDLEAVKV